MKSTSFVWGNGYYPLFFLTLFSLMITVAQTTKQRSLIVQNYDPQVLQNLITDFEKEIQLKKSKIENKLLSKQWQNSQKQLDGTIVALNDIGVDGTPLYYTTHTDPTSKVSRADALYTDGILDLGLNGDHMNVGIWDAGVARTTHQEFDGRALNFDGAAIDNHSTLVTGTLVSSGVKERARGVAYGANALCHDWSRDKIEVAEAAADGLLLSNHSYGIVTDRVPEWYFGAYIKISQDWDKIMYHAPYYLMVTAAGNAQNSEDNSSPNFGQPKDGYDLLLGFATAKNGLVVAGSDTEIDRKGILKSAQVSNYSSFGPTDDGRIKPDLAGDGTFVYSSSGLTDSSYDTTLGTSMAAPGVTGSLLLVQEYHERLFGQFMKSATLKGLVLHTADDVKDEGPDYKMGWGVINTKRAAEVLRHKDFSTLVAEETLNDGDAHEFTLKASGQEVLLVSLSWTDPEGQFVNRGELNRSKAALTNDLDIRITQDGETYFPWKLDPSKASSKAQQGDNTVDPFERIDIPNAQGEYTITITHKGKLVTNAQDFSIIVSGAELTSCQLVQPQRPVILKAEHDTIEVSWPQTNGDALYEVLCIDDDETTVVREFVWDSNFKLEALQLGKTYSIKVRSVCSENLESDFSEELQFAFNGELTVADTPLVKMDNTLSIYPNPAIDELYVADEFTSKSTYSILNTAGALVKSDVLAESKRVEVADLASGLYILDIHDDMGNRQTRFYKE